MSISKEKENLLRAAVINNVLKLSNKKLLNEDVKNVYLFLQKYPDITSVDLSDNLLTSAGALAIAACTHVKHINLSRNNIGEEGVKALSKKENLETLDISHNSLAEEALESIASHPNITKLNISHNRFISTYVIESLAKNKKLIALDISNNSLLTGDRDKLLLSATLESLNVSNTKSFEKSGDALFATTIKNLNVSGDSESLGYRVVKNYLSKNRNICSLSVNGCKLDLVDFAALSELDSLTHLDACQSRHGDDGAEAISKSRSLLSLDFSENGVGNDGAQKLASNEKLTTLNLSGNHIGDLGAKYLAMNKSMQHLNLSDNAIHEEGAKYLATKKDLLSLNMRENTIGLEGAKALMCSDIPNLQISASLNFSSVPDIFAFLCSIPKNRKFLDICSDENTKVSNVLEENVAHYFWNLPKADQHLLLTDKKYSKLLSLPAMRLVKQMTIFDGFIARAEEKAEKFKAHSGLIANEVAGILHDSLSDAKTLFCKADINILDFKRKVFDAVAIARPELEKHRGWKEFFINLLLTVTTLGAFNVYNRYTTGSFFMHIKTSSSKMLDKIEDQAKFIEFAK